MGAEIGGETGVEIGGWVGSCDVATCSPVDLVLCVVERVLDTSRAVVPVVSLRRRNECPARPYDGRGKLPDIRSSNGNAYLQWYLIGKIASAAGIPKRFRTSASSVGSRSGNLELKTNS